MRERSFRRWGQGAALAVGVLLGAGCGGLPESGGKQPDESRGNAFAQRGHQPEAQRDMEGQQTSDARLAPWTVPTDRGYNSTIHQIGSSIDPRTPKTDGKQNNSLRDDAGKMMADRYAGLGGANYSPASQGLGGEDGSEKGKTTYQRPRAGFAPLGWQDRNGPYRR
ncbi:hypothetical protein JY651_47365 [Pyxidicoccus parkwayensis]|uniref:Lipoprotein n=1 Tax=Pyxidicoccus parkwayensis TaxID=2813578 RepID=A0ABX7NUP6_9BACT|nr:hypothetical protein [Pyxidicoccus parkwaysis]QSQ22646.1 hypothetical protein JY651_47365 [Pyxidicoccus parkwaysis]